MKDVRITFRSEDFAAVSQSMIDLGVSFQVEVLEPESEEENAAPAATERRAAKKKPKRTQRSGAGRSSESGRAQSREPSGADRLRAMVERNRVTTGRPPEEDESGISGSAPPPGDEAT